jgi:hypothetical protein
MANAKKKRTRKRKPLDPTAPPTQQLSPVERNVAMFKDWIGGMTYESLGEKYGLTLDGVFAISKKQNWKTLKAQLIEKRLAAAGQEVKGMVVTILTALKRDMQMIVDAAVRENRMLTDDERDHFTKLYEKFMKESRLDDGKPTEISDETRRVELVLPPGVKRFGVIPPDPRVNLVESKPTDKDEQINLDSIEIDPKDIK